MSVLALIGAIVAAALGVWWLAVLLLIGGTMLLGVEFADRYDRKRISERRR